MMQLYRAARLYVSAAEVSSGTLLLQLWPVFERNRSQHRIFSSVAVTTSSDLLLPVIEEQRRAASTFSMASGRMQHGGCAIFYKGRGEYRKSARQHEAFNKYCWNREKGANQTQACLHAVQSNLRSSSNSKRSP